MSANKQTTAGNACSFKLPTIAIPKSVQCDEYGCPSYTIPAAAGEIVVSCCGRYARCKGSVDALVSAGFMLPEWAPGLPGNNATSQTVVFSPDGPRLFIGNRRGSQIADPLITILRLSRQNLEVVISLTPEQKEFVGAARDEHEKKKPSQSPHAAALTPDGAHGFYCHLADSAIAWIRKSMADTGCTYTHGSMNRIQQSFEGLRRAFADGRVVPLVPKYQSVGNVVCWPGRGSVAAVAPTLLQ